LLFLPRAWSYFVLPIASQSQPLLFFTSDGHFRIQKILFIKFAQFYSRPNDSETSQMIKSCNMGSRR
jgi:hypothetical protein